MNDLDMCRQEFAERLREPVGVRSDPLVHAFATVPRERFLGPGPWNVCIVDSDGLSGYRLTENSNAEQTYRDVVIAIDPARGLHNGQPSCLAMWIERLDLKAGGAVLQVGCGTGYYTAILAEVVGPAGRVVAFEVDESLADRAKTNLAHYPQVEVISAPVSDLTRDSTDAILVNCGVTQPPLSWLLALRMGGRMVVSITASSDGTGTGEGAMFLFAREGAGIAIQYISAAAFFPCVGARDEAMNRALLDKTEKDWLAPRSVRTDLHAEDSSCWLHSSRCCLSRLPLTAGAA